MLMWAPEGHGGALDAVASLSPPSASPRLVSHVAPYGIDAVCQSSMRLEVPAPTSTMAGTDRTRGHRIGP